MAFTVTLHTGGTLPPMDSLASWLTEQGEPFDVEGPQHLGFLGLPLRLNVDDDDSMIRVHIDVTPQVPLMRLVDLLFDLSVVAGADVNLAGTGPVNRPALWILLADEQDRQRIAQALITANEHGNHEEVVRRLWAVLNVLQPGHDIRWSIEQSRIVEMKEVGAAGGISIEEAAWHAPDAQLGQLVPLKVSGYLHSPAWRWLSEAYPGLCATHYSR